MSGDGCPALPTDHVCWRHDDPAAFAAAARAFLTVGLVAGEELWYVTERDPAEAREWLAAVPGLADALRDGAARVVPLDGTYVDGRIADPAAQVRAYAEATEAALAAGHAGLRVVAEATGLVRTPQQRVAFTRYEHLIDGYMRAHPFSAMCVYDPRELGAAAVAELACLHPAGNADDVLFRLYAAGRGRTGLAGELDLSARDLLATALERAAPRPVDGRLVFEAARLRFADHRCLQLLGEYARSRGAVAVLRGLRGAGVARLVDLLGLPGIRVEAAR
ncbi:MEDS domain-containing protein [Micromonospora haikouensis]|uniref:MEDS domain-containing protein n=1 Tax=Micromonospora haikouensis TaxID=686309 RepID=UPI003437CA77